MAPQPTSSLQNFGIAIEVVFPALAFIVVCLRVYARLNIKGFGWDDACIIVAMVLAVAMAVGSVFCIKLLYIGIHYWDVPASYNIEPGLVWTYVVGAIYNPILAIVKQSVLIFLLRLAETKPGVRLVVWVTAIFNAALMIAVFLAVIFQCSPIRSNWDLTVKGKCINQTNFGISTACLTIFTDIIAVALPFYVFLTLKIARKTKIALISVFLLGLLVTAVSVVRLYFFWQHLNDKSLDANYSLGFCVSAIEVNLAIITASAPALWPLVRSWLPSMFSSLGTSQGYHRNTPGNDWAPGATGTKRSATGPGGNASRNSRLGITSVSNIALKDLRRDRVRAQVSVRSDFQDSDEEILTLPADGIMRTTEYNVSHTEESRQKTTGRGVSESGYTDSTKRSSLGSY